MKVVIIGSGFGGLSAACLLAKKGYSWSEKMIRWTGEERVPF